VLNLCAFIEHHYLHARILEEGVEPVNQAIASNDCLLQEEYDFFEECFFDASGKPVLSNSTASCDIKISGIDKQVRMAMQ
jgi:hypothetical protein